jgi:hypothetical protein
MQVKRSNILRHFRGRRAVIPLVVAAAAIFVVAGGYKGIVGFAMDEMTGFLVGTGDASMNEAVASAPLPKAGDGAKGTASSGPAAPEPAVAFRGEPPLELAQADPTPRETAPAPSTTAKAAPAAAEPVGAPPGQAPPGIAPVAPEDSASVRSVESVYTASFLRDPFYSLVQAGKDVPTKLLDVSGAKMVGSVWGESGIIALLEDDTGRSFALKKGDRVLNGRVISVTPASVTFSITVFGLTKTVTLELAEEGE